MSKDAFSSQTYIPKSVASKTFSLARKGFQPREVQEFLAGLASHLEQLSQTQELHEAEIFRLQEVVENQPHAVEDVDEKTLVSLLGEQTAKVLDAAREAAEGIRIKAHEDAETLLSLAREEADELREQAENILDVKTQEAELATVQNRQKAVEILEDAERVKQRMQQEAIAQGEQEKQRVMQEVKVMLDEASQARAKILNDLSKRRKTLKQQVEQLHAARERLLEGYDVVKETVEIATREIFVMVPEAKALSQTAVLRMSSDEQEEEQELRNVLSEIRIENKQSEQSPPLDAASDQDRDVYGQGLEVDAADSQIAPKNKETEIDSEHDVLESVEEIAFVSGNNEDLVHSEENVHVDIPHEIPQTIVDPVYGIMIGQDADERAESSGDSKEVKEEVTSSTVSPESNDVTHEDIPQEEQQRAEDTLDEEREGGDPEPGKFAQRRDEMRAVAARVTNSQGSAQNSGVNKKVTNDERRESQEEKSPMNSGPSPAPLKRNTHKKRQKVGTAPTALFAQMRSVETETPTEKILEDVEQSEVVVRAENTAADKSSEPVIALDANAGEQEAVPAQDLQSPSVQDIDELKIVRDNLLVEVSKQTQRAWKRVLADEQNELLAVLRSAAQGVSLEEMLPERDEHILRYQIVVLDQVSQALISGKEFSIPHHEPKESGTKTPAEMQSIAEQITAIQSEKFVDGLRAGIIAVRHDENIDSQEQLRQYYREWKNENIEDFAESLIREGFYTGLELAYKDDAIVAWSRDR